MQTELSVSADNAVARMADIKDQQIAELVEHYESKKSPFKKWTQLNNDEEAQEARYWLMKKSPIAYCVMDFLASNMDRFNAVICSYKVMQEKFGYSRAALSEAIKLLKEHRYIDVKKSGTSNVYLINKYLYWNSWGTNYAYAEFGANVIISASEQDKDTQAQIKTEIQKRQEVIVKQNQPTFREKIRQAQESE